MTSADAAAKPAVAAGVCLTCCSFETGRQGEMLFHLTSLCVCLCVVTCESLSTGAA